MLATDSSKPPNIFTKFLTHITQEFFPTNASSVLQKRSTVKFYFIINYFIANFAETYLF